MNRRSFLGAIAALLVPQQLFAAAKKRSYQLFVGHPWPFRAADILTIRHRGASDKAYFGTVEVRGENDPIDDSLHPTKSARFGKAHEAGEIDSTQYS